MRPSVLSGRPAGLTAVSLCRARSADWSPSAAARLALSVRPGAAASRWRNSSPVRERTDSIKTDWQRATQTTTVSCSSHRHARARTSNVTRHERVLPFCRRPCVPCFASLVVRSHRARSVWFPAQFGVGRSVSIVVRASASPCASAGVRPRSACVYTKC